MNKCNFKFLKSFNFFENVGVEHFGFLVVFEGPGGLKQLRGTRRIHFHLSWYLSDPVVPSYVHFCVFQQIEFHEYLPHEYLNLSVLKQRQLTRGRKY